MVDQPEATAQPRRWWLTLLIAATLAALAVVLFAASALSRSASGSAGQTTGFRQVQQQTPSQGHNCPFHSGQQPSGSTGTEVQT